MLTTIITFVIASAALAISPGPDNIYVLTQSIVNDSKSGLATTAGLISGCIVHTTLVAFGISAIITASPFLFNMIKVVGACYLLFIAYKVYRGDSSIKLQTNAPQKSYVALYKTGVLMNVLNPKVTLFFVAFLPGFLWAPNGNTVIQFYILGLAFMLVSFIIFSSVALIAGRLANYIKAYKNIGSVLKWFQIVVFIGIAVFILI